MPKDRCLGTMACFFLHCIENDLQTEGEEEREHRTILPRRNRCQRWERGFERMRITLNECRVSGLTELKCNSGAIQNLDSLTSVQVL